MNKDTSLLSGTQLEPPFPLNLIIKEGVKPVLQMNHSSSANYALLKEN